MHKVVITGPESSGKTTLCKTLSKHFKIAYSKEYSRNYLQELNRNYNQDDLTIIAKGQLNLNQNNIMFDTDLITIKIWSNHKYGSCNKWILEQIEKQKSEKRFYLLCKPDIPWIKDPLRENPQNRMTLYQMYKKELENLNHDYYIIKGVNRAENAIAKILTQKCFI